MRKQEVMEVLQPYLVAGPEDNGDWDARCPLHDDQKRSARINFDKGVWICYAGCGKGRLTGLLKRMREAGLLKGHALVRKSDPKKKSGRVVTLMDVKRWRRNLQTDAAAQEYLWAIRDIRDKTAQHFQLGWDRASQAFTIPIFNPDGSLFNVRKYRPNAPPDKKIWWAVSLNPDDNIPLFPAAILEETDWVVITAGEMDAMIAWQYEIPAVTGTAGEGSWKLDWSEGFAGKWVFICYDRDTTGERGARQVAERLEPYARAIRVVKIPIEKKGADVSDYFLSGKSTKEFKEVLRSAARYEKRVTDPSVADPLTVSVMDSFDAQNVGRGQAMEVLISGRGQTSYTVPKVVASTCTMNKGPVCQFCPMLKMGGNTTFEVPAWSPTLLKMLGHPETAQSDALRKLLGVPVKCELLTHEIQSYQSIEQLYIRPSWEEEAGDFTPRRVYSVGRHNTMPSQVVRIIGTTWPDPREQRNEFLAWEVRESESAIDEFKITPEVLGALRSFQPSEGQTPLRKLAEIAGDLSKHVTRIYGRTDLHMAIDLVYHSLVSFPFMGKVEPRGWLDALIIGDTRTGKSEAAARLSDHYHAGFIINCEAATFAGIVGGLQQMGGSREWAVTWGAIPMNDRRLVILDEASGLAYEHIQAMSDVRSRGFVRLQKIAQEQAWARTRLLWLSNPRDGSMDAFTYGIQSLAPLIGNREDIARFDFALALTSKDVKLEAIHQTPSEEESVYTAEDCHTLVLWAWSRSAADVVWERGAEEDILKAAAWLGRRYVPDPPLIQEANVRIKLARIAVALAASTFSTDSAGKRLIVGRAHVSDATRFLHGIYGRDTFGYLRMSNLARERQARAVSSMEDAKRYLLEDRLLLDVLRSTSGSFTRETLEMSLNLTRDEANAKVNRLFEWGMVSPSGRYINMTPVLHVLLREIEEESR